MRRELSAGDLLPTPMLRPRLALIQRLPLEEPGTIPTRCPGQQEAHRRGVPGRAWLSGPKEDDVIDEELKAILVCPACKGDLLFEESRIICPACRKVYPIRDGIPVMLIDEAQPWSG